MVLVQRFPAWGEGFGLPVVSRVLVLLAAAAVVCLAHIYAVHLGQKCGKWAEYLDDVSLSNGLGLFVHLSGLAVHLSWRVVPLCHFVVTNELVGGLLTVLSSTRWHMNDVSSLLLETFRDHRATLNAWLAVCCGPLHVGSYVIRV